LKYKLFLLFCLLCTTSVAHAADLPASVLSDAKLYEALTPSIGVPTRLLIPSIKVDAAVESLGLTPSGAVAAPEGPADVAWFNQGPAPDHKGSAVIVGHFGWKDGVEAAFDNLHELHKGDMVYVQDGRGNQSSFIVMGTRSYASEADVPEAFTSDAGRHLNLITCGGTWDASKKSYTERLVVFTDRTS
jgi:sortase (surface protein transpeptidase)